MDICGFSLCNQKRKSPKNHVKKEGPRCTAVTELCSVTAVYPVDRLCTRSTGYTEPGVDRMGTRSTWFPVHAVDRVGTRSTGSTAEMFLFLDFFPRFGGPLGETLVTLFKPYLTICRLI